MLCLNLHHNLVSTFDDTAIFILQSKDETRNMLLSLVGMFYHAISRHCLEISNTSNELIPHGCVLEMCAPFRR